MTARRSLPNVVLAALGTLPVMAVGNAATLIYGNVSGWTVHTDPDQAYLCYAEALYEDESSIRIGFEPEDGSLYLVITDASWGRVSASREIELQFDEESPLSFAASRAAGGDSVRIVIPEDRRATFLKDLKLRYVFNARYGETEPVMFSLGGSLNALRLLEECQASMAQSANAK